MALKHTESEQISTRLSPKEVEEIGELVAMGFYMNTADFVRQAVREKLDTLAIIDVRTISNAKARQEILDYLKDHGRAYPSDIADALQLDIGLIMAVVKSLIKEGRIR